MEARIEEIARRCHPVAAADSRVVGLYLFGSEAEGTAGEHSNIDLAVLFPYKADVPVMDLIRLEIAFEEALNGDVHLRNLGTCDPFLALQVIRGERIYERDGLACDEFDLYVMRRAGDLAPFERERRRMILEEGAGGSVEKSSERIDRSL